MLPGLKAMLNHHPVFVHFPIALWLAALFFELLALWRWSDEWHRTAARLLYLGTLAGCVAIVTGLYAQASVPEGPAQRIVGIHQTLMVITTSLAGGLCLFAFFARNNFSQQFRRLMVVGLVLVAILLSLGADRGAQLVFQYGSAVNWATAERQK